MIEFAKDDTINIFKNIVKAKDGTEFVRYSGSLSKKNKDNTYSRMYYTVRFIGDQWKTVDRDTKLDTCYTLKVKDAFISFDEYKQGEYDEKKLVLVIREADVLDEKSVKKGADGSTSQGSPFGKK